MMGKILRISNREIEDVRAVAEEEAYNSGIPAGQEELRRNMMMELAKRHGVQIYDRDNPFELYRGYSSGVGGAIGDAVRKWSRRQTSVQNRDRI